MQLRHGLALALAYTLVGAMWACGDDDGSGPVTGLQPDVVRVTPDSGNVGTQVEIAGSSFEEGASVAFGAWPADSVVFIDATTLLAFAPDSLQRDSVYDVLVANPGGGSDVLTDAYKAVAPALQVVNGVSKPSGNAGSTVILEGKSFGDLFGKGRVFFSDAAGQPLEAPVALPENWTNEFIVSTVPSSAETGPVWIETPTGASDSIVFTITQSATFSPSLINWTETQPLPDSSQGHGAVFLSIESGPGAGNLVYVTGGADGALSPRSDVSYAEIDAAGQFSAYTSAVALPQPRAFHGTTVATPFNALIDTMVAGYLYVVGGIDDTGAPTATVYKAAVNRDRSLGTWTETTTLPVPLHSMGITIFRSWLYVAAGASSGDEPQREVYRARINPDGTLGAWEAQPSLPYVRAYMPLVQFAGVLYVLGGDTAAVAPGDNTLTATRVAEIHYQPLDLRTGELKNAAWTLNPSSLIKDVSKHSALVAGGTVLVSGGLYGGASSSATEQQFATINPDGTIQSFNGATGSQTIAGASGAGGVPFFNHAAISYVDAAGVAHVVVLGGNNVNDAAKPVPNTYFY
jgi:hypothetical protein